MIEVPRIKKKNKQNIIEKQPTSKTNSDFFNRFNFKFSNIICLSTLL